MKGKRQGEGRDRERRGREDGEGERREGQGEGRGEGGRGERGGRERGVSMELRHSPWPHYTASCGTVPEWLFGIGRLWTHLKGVAGEWHVNAHCVVT